MRYNTKIFFFITFSFICFGCLIVGNRNENNKVEISFTNVVFMCNVFDSLSYFPYEMFIHLEVKNSSYRTLLFGSNNDIYGGETDKKYGVLKLIHQADTFSLHTSGDLMKYPPKSSNSFVARYEEGFIEQIVDPLIKKTLKDKSITIDHLDIETPDTLEMIGESDSLNSETFDRFFKNFSDKNFQEQIYNYFMESKFLYIPVIEDYPSLSRNEFIMSKVYSIKIPDGLTLEFVSAGDLIEYYKK